MGGGIQVAHSFINQIKLYKTFRFIIVVTQELNKQLIKSNFSEYFKFVIYNVKPNIYNSITGKNDFLDNLVNKYQVDKVFTVFGPSYWKPKVPHLCGFAKPQYIYKNSPFFKKITINEFFKIKIKELLHMYSFNNHCDELVTENIDVSKRLSKRLSKNVFTVTNYYNQVFENEHVYTNQDQSLMEFDGLKLLTVSANYSHKNLSIIPKVIEYLNFKYPDFQFKFYLTVTRDEISFSRKFDRYIEYLGPVNIKACPSIYKFCDFMFLPTLLECFSASYCEAMKMKKPILTSKLDFALGLCKNSAVYFDPMSPSSIGKSIKNLYDDKKKQKKLIKNGTNRLQEFDSYEIRAKKYLQILKNETNYTRS